ncbi:MAG: DinB family protein [Cyanothece sp. SIO1E1]|nr:DinB family protein [Cyanothece sp. SIO1E1]
MSFSLSKSIEVLERTPAVLESLLVGISDEWIHSNEGEHTWSPYQVIGHLIHGEKTDWIPRTKIILSNSPDKTFDPFDRFAQLNDPRNLSISELLDEFKTLRKQNLDELISLDIDDHTTLSKIGIHPEFGDVTLKELLSTWTVHDLGHIAQIARVMAKQYKSEVGPWIEYIRILRD